MLFDRRGDRGGDGTAPRGEVIDLTSFFEDKAAAVDGGSVESVRQPEVTPMNSEVDRSRSHTIVTLNVAADLMYGIEYAIQNKSSETFFDDPIIVPTGSPQELEKAVTDRDHTERFLTNLVQRALHESPERETVLNHLQELMLGQLSPTWKADVTALRAKYETGGNPYSDDGYFIGRMANLMIGIQTPMSLGNYVASAATQVITHGAMALGSTQNPNYEAVERLFEASRLVVS